MHTSVCQSGNPKAPPSPPPPPSPIYHIQVSDLPLTHLPPPPGCAERAGCLAPGIFRAVRGATPFSPALPPFPSHCSHPNPKPQTLNPTPLPSLPCVRGRWGSSVCVLLRSGRRSTTMRATSCQTEVTLVSSTCAPCLQAPVFSRSFRLLLLLVSVFIVTAF